MTNVDIDEIQIFSTTEQRLRMTPFLGRCIDAGLIREILNEISSYYIDGGYVTTRPYLLEQDINDGQIEIQVLIGTVEAIVDAESGGSNGKLATAFAFNNKTLNLRELETSLEAIERVPSVSAEIEIRPGRSRAAVSSPLKPANPIVLELSSEPMPRPIWIPSSVCEQRWIIR